MHSRVNADTPSRSRGSQTAASTASTSPSAQRTGVARDPQVGEEAARLERHMQARPAVKVEAVARGTVPDVAAQIRIVLAQQGVKHPDGQFVFDARLAWR